MVFVVYGGKTQKIRMTVVFDQLNRFDRNFYSHLIRKSWLIVYRVIPKKITTQIICLFHKNGKNNFIY